MKVTVKNIAVNAAILAGSKGLNRPIVCPQVITPDLSRPLRGREMVSCVLHIRPTQAAYLCSLPRDERVRLISTLMRQKPACIIVTSGTVCRELLERMDKAGISVVKVKDLSGVNRLLTEKLTPQISIHGVLVQIFGLGTLIIGESAVGKSEAALDLVLRGHRLVADDIVILWKTVDDINGSSTDMGGDLLQIRGLGVINIKALYGESATVSGCKVGLVVEMEEWRRGQQYALIGLRERRYRILGVNLPYLKLPVKPGRNMATLVEVAARNQMLKNQGIYTARELNKKLMKRLSS